MIWFALVTTGLALLFVPPFSFQHPWQSMWMLPGALLFLIAERRRGFSAGTAALNLLGIVIAQYGVLFALTPLFARYHQMAGLSFLPGSILRVCGSNVCPGQDSLLVRMPRGIYEIAVTSESLALPLFAVTATGLIMLSGSLRMALKGMLTLACYVPIRFVLAVMLFLCSGRIDVFWKADVLFLTMLPVCVFLPRVVNPKLCQMSERLPYRALVLILLASSIGGFTCFWDNPGAKKQGRLVIDEAHGHWERTDRPYTTTWYGEDSGYNYYCLTKYLESYYSVRRNLAPISSHTLRNCDVLILKTPTHPYSDGEVRAIHRYVSNGGGVLLVGDHTDVFGMDTCLNKIANCYGINFNSDVTYDLDTGSLNFYQQLPLCSHPAALQVDTFLFGSTCSLSTKPNVKTAMLGADIKTLRADYSRNNFFPDDEPTPNLQFGVFVQAAAAKSGEGRVFALSDSTPWSNFWFHLPGKSELLLGITDWLNRRNGTNVSALVILTIVVLLATARIWQQWNNRSYICLAIVLGVLVGTAAAHILNSRAYPVLNQVHPMPAIAFDLEHSGGVLPTRSLNVGVQSEKQFHTFYVWIQRLGYVPKGFANLNDCLMDGNPIVIVRPLGITGSALIRLRDYVRQGGVLLLLTPLAQKHSLWIDLGGPPGLPKDHFETGHGIVFFGDADRFSNRTMGHTGTRPSSAQMSIYNDEFCLIRRLWAEHVRRAAKH